MTKWNRSGSEGRERHGGVEWGVGVRGGALQQKRDPGECLWLRLGGIEEHFVTGESGAAEKNESKEDGKERRRDFREPGYKKGRYRGKKTPSVRGRRGV